MANPFQGVAQMGVNEFWGWLQALSTNAKKVKADLDADRSQLMMLYSDARNDTDKARGAAHMKALDPLVHNNSALRLRYLDLVAKFKGVVNGVASALKAAGLSTPELSGLGVAPAVIAIGLIVAAAAAWGVYETVAVATAAQRKATNALANILADPSASDQEKLVAAQALAKQAAQSNPFDLGKLTPILIGVLAIMVAPTVLSMVKSSRRAAA
jgi:hypothetical protein